jgi:hypothetical protein
MYQPQGFNQNKNNIYQDLGIQNKNNYNNGYGQNDRQNNYAQNNQQNIYRKNNLQNNYGQQNNYEVRAPPIQQNKKNSKNQKYQNLEIETFFGNGGQNLSQKDQQLQNELRDIEAQCAKIFNDIDSLTRNFSGGDNGMDKVQNIKKELVDLDNYNATEHGKFVSELYEVTKDEKILYDYATYKENISDCDNKLIKNITDFKYDVLLAVNKHNSTENISRIKRYINEKKNAMNNNEQKNKSNYNNNNNKSNNNNINYNNNNNNNYNNNYNNEKQQNKYEYGNNNYENKNRPYGGNNIYGNQNPNNGYPYPAPPNPNNAYPNPNSGYTNPNSGYENPNEYENDYGGQNNYNQNQKSSNKIEKITVKFVSKDQTITRDYNSDEIAYILYYTGMEMKDNPKIYDSKGRYYDYESLKDLTIGEVFKETEPTLKIY